MPARILVVEDNPANLELMRYLLEAFGHTVLTANDGEEGLAAVRDERPDLVVCDVQLPALDGYSVARQLKSVPDLLAIPLLAVTALAMAGDREKAISAGFDGYVAKPINPETFVQQVESFLHPELHSTQAMADQYGHSPAASAVPATGPMILVVDNQRVNLEFAASLLTSSGYRVILADSMHEALALARRTRPDLILSDVCMGRASGYDFIGQVKADPGLSTIPFVFITSTVTTEQERTKGLALGATRFLFRPLEPQVLLGEIESCLRERRSE